MVAINHFDDEVEKKKESWRYSHKDWQFKYVDVLHIRFSLDPFVNVRCCKPKWEIILTLQLIRRDSKGEYAEKIHVFDLVKYGYSE